VKQDGASMAVIRDKGEITIPSSIRKAAHLREGDAFDVLNTADGILLRPRKPVAATQAWFWAPAWQTAEHEATDDIRKGPTRTYETEKDFLRRFEK
jgi:AbrB family looped-hinge helix DNA binding protein